MMGYGERSQRTLLHVSGRVRDADVHVGTAAELAVQSGPQAGQGRALGVLGSRPLRLVLLDHDQPVAPLVQGVELNAGFAVRPGDRGLEGRERLGVVLGDRKGSLADALRSADPQDGQGQPRFLAPPFCAMVVSSAR